jgi:uncharacterized protein (DUF1778 family)
MPQSSASPTFSLRLPKEARERLDRATQRTRRSRSFLVVEALDRYLDEIEREQRVERSPARFSRLMALEGVGRRADGPRTSEDIDAHIRWLRGDDGAA